MSKDSFTLSVRLPADIHNALSSYANSLSVTVSDAVVQLLCAQLAKQDTTDEATKKRLSAEIELSDRVLQYANGITDTQYDPHVTLVMFDWIEANHRGLYEDAVGPGGAYCYRINPQLAKRFAYAIGAEPIPNESGKASKAYLERNANKLIQSYTLLRKA